MSSVETKGKLKSNWGKGVEERGEKRGKDVGESSKKERGEREKGERTKEIIMQERKRDRPSRPR